MLRATVSVEKLQQKGQQVDPVSVVRKAEAFAREAHKDLVRPNKAQQPYATHLQEVAELVEQSGGTDEEIAAAWLHDVIEDTDTTLDDIEQQFGKRIAIMVDGLTDHPDLSGLPTHERKRLQAERVRHKSASVKRIKVADQTSNVRSVAIDPPVRWLEQKCREYIAGARLIANECRGISPYLDAEFDAAHARAVRVYP